MKNKFILIVLLISFSISFSFSTQAQRKTLSVLNIDAQGMSMTPKQMGNLVRIEIEKLDTFEVMDRYDVAYLIEKHDLKIDNCYGKICLVETGQILEADKMLSGSVELYGETIIMTLRIVDVASSTIERTHIREFLNMQKEMQSMVRITLNEMLDRPVEPYLIQRLTKKFDYENALNNPNASKVNLSGPRMGATFFTGNIAEFMSAPEQEGGYDVIPVMFQFGYQFEVQYLNQGNFQALFEFIPLVTGLDQGLVIPSLTIFNGMRDNLRGWELAFGPTFNVVRKADGYYDPDGKWNIASDWDGLTENPYPILNRTDSRGDYTLSTGFVFAVGKTFKSGKLNIPINLYVIPSKEGVRGGISFGYNAKK